MSRPHLLVMAAAAAALLVAGAALPLWTMTLHAPQYPKGLRLIIDGRGARGDVDELNTLNHYIGMRPMPGAEPGEDRERDEGLYEAFPELRLFTPGVAALALGILLVPFITWRLFRPLVALGAWALPLGFLADLQYRLYVFGHTLNPDAAFRMPAFTPKVLGPTVVMNFNVTAWPGLGLVLFALSAIVLTIGPRLPIGGATRRRVMTAAAVTGLALLVAASPGAVGAALPVSAAAPGAGSAAFDLKAAVAAAAPGAVVAVPAGRYPGPLVLSRPITLVGQGYPVIDGGRRGDVLVIAAPDVRVEGFEIRGSALAYSSEAAGIAVRGDRAVIRRNRVTDVLFGVYLAGTTGTVVEDNAIATADLPVERRGHAVYLWKARDVAVRRNRITRGKDGLYISFSDLITVSNNTITGCRYGIHYMYSNNNTFTANLFKDNAVGGAVMNSTDVTLRGNTFEGSRSAETGVGLIFKDVDRVLMTQNRVVRNRIALEFENAPSTPDGWVRIERNVIAFNETGFSLMSTAAITVTENALVENLRQVQSRGAVQAGANRWWAGGRGNYWSDYTGFDASGDGVGDVPYRRTDLLEDLADRVPALQAFLFTPAHHAVDTAARMLPILAAKPVVEDRSPLMRPPAAGPTAAGAEPVAGARVLWVGAVLLIPAMAGLITLRPRRTPR
jgi:nitrous oxidase accessory protein